MPRTPSTAQSDQDVQSAFRALASQTEESLFGILKDAGANTPREVVEESIAKLETMKVGVEMQLVPINTAINRLRALQKPAEEQNFDKNKVADRISSIDLELLNMGQFERSNDSAYTSLPQNCVDVQYHAKTLKEFEDQICVQYISLEENEKRYTTQLGRLDPRTPEAAITAITSSYNHAKEQIQQLIYAIKSRRHTFLAAGYKPVDKAKFLEAKRALLEEQDSLYLQLHKHAHKA